MNSIQVIKALNRGGAEMLLYTYFHRRHLKKRQLCVLSGINLSMLEDFQKIGVEIYIFRIFDKIFSIKEYFRFVSFVATNKNDAIFHSHLPMAGVVVRSCKLFFNFKSVYTEHNVLSMYHSITYFLNLWSYCLENKIIACSDNVKRSIPNILTRNVVTIHNGVDFRRFPLKDGIQKWEKMINSGVINIVCVAGFRQEKNHLLLLNVVKLIVKKGFRVKLKLIGDGIGRDELKKFVTSNQLQEYVDFEGIQHNIYPYLRWANFFCLTSKFEGLPVSLLEAMSAGCIPVCSNVGGISEVFSDESFPLVTLNHNIEVDANSFVVKILFLYTLSPHDLYAKSLYASNIVRKSFSFELMTEKIFCIYRNLAQK